MKVIKSKEKAIDFEYHLSDKELEALKKIELWKIERDIFELEPTEKCKVDLIDLDRNVLYMCLRGKQLKDMVAFSKVVEEHIREMYLK